MSKIPKNLTTWFMNDPKVEIILEVILSHRQIMSENLIRRQRRQLPQLLQQQQLSQLLQVVVQQLQYRHLPDKIHMVFGI